MRGRPPKNKINSTLPDLIQKEEDATKILRLYFSGWSVEDIRREVNISAHKVREIISAQRILMQEVRYKETQQFIEDTLNSLDYWIKEAAEAFDKSKNKAHCKIITRSNNPESNFGSQTDRLEEQYGDPRFLTVINNFIKTKIDAMQLIRPAGSVNNVHVYLPEKEKRPKYTVKATDVEEESE